MLIVFWLLGFFLRTFIGTEKIDGTKLIRRNDSLFLSKKACFQFNQRQNSRSKFQETSSSEWKSISKILKKGNLAVYTLIFENFFPEFNSPRFPAGSLDPSGPVIPSIIARWNLKWRLYCLKWWLHLKILAQFYQHSNSIIVYVHQTTTQHRVNFVSLQSNRCCQAIYVTTLPKRPPNQNTKISLVKAL